MTIVPADLADRLGWLILQSLWQFALIAFVCQQLLWRLAHASASTRYRVALGGLTLMAAALAATSAWWPLPEAAEVEPSRVASIADADGPPLAHRAPVSSSATQARTGASTSPGDTAPLPLSWPGWSFALDRSIRPWLPGIALFWCAGLVVFSIRPLAGWMTVCRLRRSGVAPPSEVLQAVFQRTAGRFSNGCAASILQTTRIIAPVTIGFLRPLILIPVRAATSLSPLELEAVVAHELAHIQRHDFLVNILQTLVETVFFYHPAVWWLSHRIRIERENCCDDLAADVLGSRVEYGRALVALEDLRTSAMILAPGANDGDLLARIRRLASDPAVVPAHSLLSIAMLSLGTMLVGLVVLLHQAEVLAQAPGQNAADTGAAESEDDKTIKGEEKKPDPLEGAPTGDAPFRVRLEGGAVVELAAIGMRSEGDEPAWWDPAGTDLPEAPRLPGDNSTLDVRMELMKDHQFREVVIRVWKPERSGVEVRNSGPLWGTTMYGVNFIRCRLQVPLREEQADFTVRYANGPWKVAGAAEANADVEVNGVHFHPFDRQNGRAMCHVEHPFADCERRIVAFDKSGKWHEGFPNSRQHSGKSLKDTTEFQNVPEDEIARIVLEVRPVTSVAFRNVALHRGKSTKPEVLIDGKPVSERTKP